MNENISALQDIREIATLPVTAALAALALTWAVWYFTGDRCSEVIAVAMGCNTSAVATFINPAMLKDIVSNSAIAATGGGVWSYIMITRERRAREAAEKALAEERQRTEEARQQADEQRHRAEEERLRAGEAMARVDEERLRAGEAMARVEEERLRAGEAMARVEEERLRAGEAMARVDEERQRAGEAMARVEEERNRLLAEIDRLTRQLNGQQNGPS